MNNTRGSRGRGGDFEPWDALRPIVYRQDGKEKTRFRQCGTAWPLTDKEGFSVELDFALPEGARIVIMPRKSRDER
jgi:hypothetical protein